MRFAPLAFAALIGVGSILTASAAQFGQATVVAKSLAAAPQSRVEASQALDDATAAALIGAISSQFGERVVEVKLDTVDATPAGLIQRDLRGSGRLLIGNDDTWIPFRFRALYDTEQATVGSPTLVLGAESAGSVLAGTSPIVKKLGSELDRRLRGEFAGQSARFTLGTVHMVPTGTHLLRLQATGTARFGAEGQSDANVRALYDTRVGEWVQLDYQLGPTNATPLKGAVALR